MSSAVGDLTAEVSIPSKVVKKSVTVKEWCVNNFKKEALHRNIALEQMVLKISNMRDDILADARAGFLDEMHSEIRDVTNNIAGTYVTMKSLMATDPLPKERVE